MSRVTGDVAFLWLRESLGGKREASSFTCADVAFERLRLAIIDTQLSTLDRAVRFRHALRYAGLGLDDTNPTRSLPMPQLPGWPDATQAKACGLTIRAGRETYALPWKPDWLAGVGENGTDAAAMRAALRPWTHRYPVADDWLQRLFGHMHYRGAGQALAIRSALHMPPHETLLAVMPTGEGKSLVFQALAGAYPGQTVAVVVPTVTLALDHANSLSAAESLKSTQPHAYVGGQHTSNTQILARIPNGEQGLIFSAPEAFIGRLRQPLLEAAKLGRLAAFVIDEAHLVDAWGTDFRNEFQLLGALVAELRAVAPNHQKPRIICLSATVTQDAFNTLETLFSPSYPLAIVPAARLRPEIDNWIAQPTWSVDKRNSRVLEALRHLPRPAVLYVTRQDDAEDWYDRLRECGYARVGVVHGASTTENRREVVDRWRTGELDLVVGTSAFGLGIDYPHVRTVVHACIPESLDRYYQEVGRSGRDGRASISVLIPHHDDVAIATGVAHKKIISVDKGLGRWESMFLSGERDERAPSRFLIDPTVSPAYDPDMQGERNEDWNGRVLSLLAGAGVIALAGLRFDHTKKTSMVAIDVLRDDHLQRRLWDGPVEARRRTLLRASTERLSDMTTILANTECPSERLATLYALEQHGITWNVGRACGGCRCCRASRADGWFAHWPNAPVAPWAIGHLSTRVAAFNVGGRCFVEYELDGIGTLAYQRRIKETIQGLWADGLRKCIAVGPMPHSLQESLAARPWCVAKGTDRQILGSNGLPPGPEMVWIGARSVLAEHDLMVRAEGAERIYFIPAGTNDPARSEYPLADRFQLVPFSLLYETLQT